MSPLLDSHWLLQSGLAAGMFAITAISGLLPLILLRSFAKRGKDQTNSGWLSYLSCFSGGVFMATCFLDVIPHINENYYKILTNYGYSDSFPFSQLMICVGFFFVYFIEEFTNMVFNSGGHGHSHGTTDESRKENVNVRNEGALILPSPANTYNPYKSTENNGEKDVDVSVFDNEDAASSNGNIRSLVVEETANWVVSDEKSNLLKSLTFAIAMSFHSLLEGFALGVQDTKTRIMSLFVSLILHKSVEAFSVGLQISKSNKEKTKTVIFTILIYAFMTPLGSMLGTALQSSSSASFYKDGAILVLESMAAGTFIYVTFIEVLAHEKSNNFNSLKQLCCILAGFILILFLQLIFGGHEHSEAEEHFVTHSGR